jgi:polysaccharide export outer membrane protein
VLGPDDQIKVWALGVDEIADKPLRLDPAGDVDLPLIGKIHAGGLTVDQLKDLSRSASRRTWLTPKFPYRSLSLAASRWPSWAQSTDPASIN